MPEESIAQTAIEPRHDARLLDTRDMSDHSFLDLPDLLSVDDLLVVNDTRVRPARLLGTRPETGGQVELLILDGHADGTWEALARPSRRLRAGVELEFSGLSAMVLDGPIDGRVRVRFDTDDVEQALASVGTIPLPPYFRGTLEDDDRYQTVFAAEPGSAAAPTAGLHFTPMVMDRLEDKGVGIARVDLHVSLDTFRPMSGDDVEDHEMHSEWCSVPKETSDLVAATREKGGRIIAVGTTVVRTLESMADQNRGVAAGQTRTDLFLTPGSEFGVVDGMITNFHLPGSTLLVLLAAFMGPGWHDAYTTALERGYRFLSFGDAMFCVRSDT